MKLWSKLALTLLGVALIPTAIVTITLVTLNSRQLARDAKQFRLAAAETASELVEQRIEQTCTELKWIGQILARSDLTETNRLQEGRDRLRAATAIDHVDLYSSHGDLALSLTSDVAPQASALNQLSKRDRAATGARGLSIQLRLDEKPAVMRITIPIFTEEKKAGIGRHASTSTGTAPPKKSRLYGYISAPIALDALSNALGDMSIRRFGRRDAVYVVDDTLETVAHANLDEVGKQTARTMLPELTSGQLKQNVAYSADTITRSGDRILANVQPIALLGWGVIAFQDYTTVYSTVRQSWWRALAVGLACGIIAVLLGVLLGRRLARPISAVASAATRVASGDWDASVDVKTQDEVGQMSHAFNTMTGDLRRMRDTLLSEAETRANLSRYLSGDLVNAIVTGDQNLELGGARQVVTVLFADVVAFTPLAERHRPEQVVGVLNELFTFLTEIVFRHGGTVDKFIGDCVMAVFGAPVAHPDDPVRAVRAATDMMDWLDVGNAKWRKEIGRELQLGIGINTGEAVVGNLGSTKRMEYTVVGDTVNIAARLEMLAQPGQILITHDTMMRLPSDIQTNDLGKHDITGRAQRVHLFEVRQS